MRFVNYCIPFLFTICTVSQLFWNRVCINRVNVFLQETHSNDENEIEWNKWWEGNLVLSHETNNSAGVATLFKREGLMLFHAF